MRSSGRVGVSDDFGLSAHVPRLAHPARFAGLPSS